MLEEMREDGIQSSRPTSFSGTGGRILRKGSGYTIGELVGSWSFCLVDFLFLCEIEGKRGERELVERD